MRFLAMFTFPRTKNVPPLVLAKVDPRRSAKIIPQDSISMVEGTTDNSILLRLKHENQERRIAGK